MGSGGVFGQMDHEYFNLRPIQKQLTFDDPLEKSLMKVLLTEVCMGTREPTKGVEVPGDWVGDVGELLQ